MRGDETASAAAGITNIETRVPVTTGTLFQIGSITKIYTATLIMQLVDEGRISLDASPAEYLPGLRFGDDDARGAITLRHLLTHTSGVDGDFFDDFGRGQDAVARYVDACAGLDQVFPPGEMWSYCNAGFVVLGRIIEVLTGQPWERVLRDRLLQPIGAHHTLTLPEEALLHNTSAGHRVTPSLEVLLARPWNMAWAAGPAGATPCSTVADLLTFARMHIDGGIAHDGARVLSPSSAQAMREPQVTLPPNPWAGATRWGLGWMLFDWGGRRVIGHDGGTIGQASSMRILPDERFAVAVLTNSVSGPLLTHRVMRWLFDEVMGVTMPERARPPDQPPAFDLAPYAGIYERRGVRHEVTPSDAALAMKTVNTAPIDDEVGQFPPAPLIPVDESMFLFRSPLGTWDPVVFSGFAGGHPRYIYSGGRVARRMS
jgi:CubicO group peptidase (beta-lactamase class C family)